MNKNVDITAFNSVTSCSQVFISEIRQHAATCRQIDARADAACDLDFPGSRNIRGIEIADGSYQNVAGLPPNPIEYIISSCPGCGLGCDADREIRLGVSSPSVEWNELTRQVALGTEDSERNAGWVNEYSGNILSATCVKKPMAVTE
eukprot:scaffold128673_cov29-Attheya_sp.AAC.1